MKKGFLYITILLLPTFLFAQMKNDWGAFNQRLDAKNFAGKKFKLQAAVKVQLIDPTSEAEIWVRVDRPNRKTGFFYNMMDKPIRVKEWEIFSIEGKVDKDAEYIAFGGLYSRKGIFYFDDFKLSIETTKGNYEEVKIQNGNFESDSLKSPWGFFQKRNGFVLSATTETSFEGKQSCKVDGSQFKKSPTYGNNDSTGKYVDANGIKIYYEEYGQGQPLLLLHGNSESIQSFRQQIPEFSKYYRVIAVDTRGQGKSSENGMTYSYDLFADDMNALLNILNIDSANILGWSDGGNTGLIMAMKYPKKVKRLITMGANVFIDNSVVDKWVFKELHKQLKEMKNDTAYADRNRVRLINLLLTEPKHNFEELKIISSPVLVLAGEKDVIKENHTRSIAQNIRYSKLIIATKETHYYPAENSKAFNETVIEFLREN
ncbi:MAG: alpha/beta hydrolase [Ferruginibacter sp.]|nr:alpha/beta hydrolase [Ferruginibacter sp.]